MFIGEGGFKHPKPSWLHHWARRIAITDYLSRGETKIRIYSTDNKRLWMQLLMYK